MEPGISRNGKYVLKLQLNGCYRQIVIDDRLPTSRTSRSLFVTDRNNDSILWPALVEKAYLKARGGYNLPGSNSGTDLWILTGWIPEQLFLQRYISKNIFSLYLVYATIDPLAVMRSIVLHCGFV